MGAGRERVKLQGRVQGGVPRHPGPRGSGVWALSSAALSAWGGSRLPRSCRRNTDFIKFFPVLLLNVLYFNISVPNMGTNSCVCETTRIFIEVAMN